MPATALIPASAGGFPRSGETLELVLLGRTVAAAERGERTPADLADAERGIIRLVIAEQLHAGIEVITDGGIRWRDPVSAFAGKLDGVTLGPPQPWLGGATTFRQPLLTRRPAHRGAVLVDDYIFAANALGSLATPPDKAGRLRLKPVLPGPYTLARVSAGEGAMSALEARVEAFAEALAAEVAALCAAGAGLVQVDEPAILRHPGDAALLAAGWAPLAAQRGPRLQLALYAGGGDAAPLYTQLAALPVDLLGLDFVSSPQLSGVVASAGAPVPLGLGLVDGRNPALEHPAGVARQAEPLLAAASGAAHLHPSCGLESLTWPQAAAKLALLAEICALVGGRSAGQTA